MNLIKILDVLRRFTDIAYLTPDITYFGNSCFVGYIKTKEIKNTIVLYKNIDSLLRLIDLFDKPVIKYDEESKSLLITDEEKKENEARFITSDPDLVKPLITNEETAMQFEKTLKSNLVVEFSVDQKLLNNIKKASQVINNPYLIIKADPSLSLKVETLGLYNTETHTYKASLGVESEKLFNIALPLTEIVNIPNDTYNFKIYYSSKVDSYRLILINKTQDISFLVPCENVE